MDLFSTMLVDLFSTIFFWEGVVDLFLHHVGGEFLHHHHGCVDLSFTNFRGVGGFTGFGVGFGMVEDFVLNIWSYYTAAKSPLTNPQPYKSRSFTTSIASYLFRECKKRTYPAPSGHESQEKGILLP